MTSGGEKKTLSSSLSLPMGTLLCIWRVLLLGTLALMLLLATAIILIEDAGGGIIIYGCHGRKRWKQRSGDDVSPDGGGGEGGGGGGRVKWTPWRGDGRACDDSH